MGLIRKISRLIRAVSNISIGQVQSSFTTLAPVDDAQQYNYYSEAISFALSDPHISNIGLSGPYGSGKSSIISTYIKKDSNYSFLNVSLASFREDENSSLDSTLIERSILQQMLYSASANELPNSRFKRILIPKHSLIKSAVIVLWPILSLALYTHYNEFLTLESYTLEWCIWISLVSFVIAIPIIILSDFYKSSFGLSLKKISLKNAEIETCQASDNSILNRYLDEIIYFFQVVDYDVVVIEDLDRFGKPEIFVKLREINKIINDNNKKHGRDRVRFLYALKDDMFTRDNRAKFFDFIIPVVPIINSSNSLDMLHECLREYDFAQNIDEQFLREASLYISDLRLIHNIFNEFEIYYDILKSERLDVTKLFAMMLYKNIYPKDFDSLHHGQGALFEICKNKSEYLQNSKDNLKKQIEKIRALIKSAGEEEARNIQELISIYTGYMISFANQPVYGIVINNQHIGLSQLRTFDKFTPLMSEKNIMLANNPGNNKHHRVPINKSFSQIEEEINPGETFLDRKNNIENTKNKNIAKLQEEIKDLEKKVAGISHLPLFKLIQKSNIDLVELADKHKIGNCDLFKYLVSNGYLDDTYYLYISNFHEGRLTNNDRDFLLTIRSFNRPDPDQILDTPSEVCASMRKEDFEQEYVLNVSLIDYLLHFSSQDTNSVKLRSAVRYISQEFEHTEAFFAAYFISGSHLRSLINSLCEEWPELACSAISSKHGAELISYVLKYVDPDYICEKMNIGNALTKYLSEFGYLVLTSDYGKFKDYVIFKKLGVSFNDLSSLEVDKSVLDYVYKENLYSITPQNVSYILKEYPSSNDASMLCPDEANYTYIQDAGSDRLKGYVNGNLTEYITKVFLTIETNTSENETAILSLITNDSLDDELKESIITKQHHVFNSFENIPEELWSHMLFEEKVAISWQTISDYLNCEEHDTSFLTKIVDRPNITKQLSNTKISIENLGDDASKALSKFIYYNGGLSDRNYCELINSLPYYYTVFPIEVSNERTICLINKRKVRLSEDSYNYIKDDAELIALLISHNISAYLDDKELYAINDEVRELLLESEMPDKNKIEICYDISPQGTLRSDNLCNLITKLLISNNTDYSKINDEVLRQAIIRSHSISDSILLIMKCLYVWDEARTMEVLAELPGPYNEISIYGKRPKIDNTKTNLEFANLLEQMRFISSYKEEGKLIRINTFKSDIHEED